MGVRRRGRGIKKEREWEGGGKEVGRKGGERRGGRGGKGGGEGEVFLVIYCMSTGFTTGVACMICVYGHSDLNVIS